MKKSLFLFIALIAGLAIGYFIPHGNAFDFSKITHGSDVLKELTKNEVVRKEILADYKHSFVFTEKPITVTDAKALIAAFKTQNADDINAGGGLRCADAANNVHDDLGGFVISRKAIDAIFKNDGTQQCNGIRVYFAKHPDFRSPSDRVFTFIFAGTKPGKDKPIDDTGADIQDPVYDHVDPCPNNCGDLRP